MATVDKDTGFKISLGLEEDVATELEDFALLVRLGVTEDAMYLVDNVLQEHLNHFAVVVEVTQYLLDLRDFERLRALMKTIRNKQICFDDNDESRFVETVEVLLAALPDGLYDIRQADIRFGQEMQPNGRINFDSATEARSCTSNYFY